MEATTIETHNPDANILDWEISFQDLSILLTKVYPKILGRIWNNQDDLNAWVESHATRISFIRQAGLTLGDDFPIFPHPPSSYKYQITNVGLLLPLPDIPATPGTGITEEQAIEVLLGRYMLLTGIFELPSARDLPLKPPCSYDHLVFPAYPAPTWVLTGHQMRSIMLAVPRMVATYWLASMAGVPPKHPLDNAIIKAELNQLFEVDLSSFYTGQWGEGTIDFVSGLGQVMISPQGLRFPKDPPSSLGDIYQCWADGTAQNSVVTITPVTQ